MNLRIENMEPYPMAFFRQIGAYGANNILTMEKIKSWAKRNALFTEDCVIVGIAQDDPAKTPSQQCRYDAGIIIPENFHRPENENISFGFVPGGRYGVFTIAHTAEALGKAWTKILVALTEEGFEIDEKRPIFERYPYEMVANHFCEICVPVK